jgi:hypothetical protein
VRTSAKIALKVTATLLATAIAFCLGGWAGAAYCDHWVMPGLVKQYPHDGQLGLEVMMYAINGGFLAALIILVIGVTLTVKTSRQKIAK